MGMRTRSAVWKYEFTHEPGRLWDLITNTDQMNRFMGLPQVGYGNEPRAGGGTQRIGRYKVLGLELVWVESPYEWVKNQFFSVERRYRSGPLRNMTLSWKLAPKAGGGCTLTQTIEYEPSHAMTAPIAAFEIHGNLRRSFAKFYRHVEVSLTAMNSASLPLVSQAVFAPRPDARFNPGQSVVKRVEERLKQIPMSAALQAKFMDLLLGWQDADLLRIRPFAVAQIWDADREETLSGFLNATKAGLFDLSWDIICPNCRGAKVRNSTLSGLKKQAHCDQCNITYDSQFDRSVELSFTPNPSIRKIEVAEFCAGSPQNTQHFLLQLRVPPGAKKSFALELKPGLYRFRSLQCKRRYSIQVEPSGVASQILAMEFGPGEPEPLRAVVGAGTGMAEVFNRHPHELILTLEQGERFESACTAAFVTSFQDFRDLFATEVLHVGEELSLGSVTILFTDLKDSTALYSKIGDAKAFALVSEHLKSLTACVRRNHGAVIKTIGDAVMASFVHPENAIEAAQDIQAHVAQSAIVPGTGERLSVKIGIHSGPCFVVNLNERLDYFGTTVNLAARAQNECENGGILVTGKMIEDPGVLEALRKSGLEVEKILRRIKGMDGEIELYRVMPRPAQTA